MTARLATGRTRTTADSSPLGACPLCTEIVTISVRGVVEPHRELVVDHRGLAALAGWCRAGGRTVATLRDVYGPPRQQPRTLPTLRIITIHKGA